MYLQLPYPGEFVVSQDGRQYASSYCDTADCQWYDLRLKENCEARSNGVPCHLLASKGQIVWEGPVTVRSRDAGLPEVFCDVAAPGSKICLSFASVDHEACGGGDIELESYVQCRMIKLDARRKVDLDPSRPNIVVCDVGAGDFLAVDAGTCYEKGGDIARALSPISVEWAGFDDILTGYLSFSEKGYRGVVRMDLPGGGDSCQGFYYFEGYGYGKWTVKCSNSLQASGTFETRGVKDTTGEGIDSEGRALTFRVAPLDLQSPADPNAEPSVKTAGGKGA